ncbi:hypothetical protein F5887DRAFT_1228350 [Amanita rubescens]|nr:hypothetical protein F5887DRAFT_1228350 [Amanita rubescens]
MSATQSNRYATPAVRDHDTSVEHVLDQVKAKTVRETLELDEKCKFFLLKLGENDYIIGKKPAYVGISSPTGRSTRTFCAFCKQSDKTAFLKDTWCIIIAGQLPKHQIYPRLHAKKMISQEVAKIFSRDFPKFRKFKHYRLALDDMIGRDLCAFSSVKALVKAIHNAAIAHDGAFFEADILHQDISVGNVIILNNGTGLLVDWDLCKIMNPESKNEGHTIGCTGTWQFSVACVLFGYDHEPPHNHEDNLESFYHVLNWMAL